MFIKTYLLLSFANPLFPKCEIQHNTKHANAHGCVNSILVTVLLVALKLKL